MALRLCRSAYGYVITLKGHRKYTCMYALSVSTGQARFTTCSGLFHCAVLPNLHFYKISPVEHECRRDWVRQSLSVRGAILVRLGMAEPMHDDQDMSISSGDDQWPPPPPMPGGGSAPSIRDRLKRKGVLASPKRAAKASAQPPRASQDSSSKTQEKGKSSGKGGGCKKQVLKGCLKGGRGKKYCKGCNLYWPVESFNVNDTYCPQDRPAIKRLQRAAAAQGKSDKYKSIKADPMRLQNLLSKYHESVGDQGDRIRRPPWSWVSYEEYEAAEKQCRRRLKGIMMHEDLLEQIVHYVIITNSC